MATQFSTVPQPVDLFQAFFPHPANPTIALLSRLLHAGSPHLLQHPFSIVCSSMQRSAWRHHQPPKRRSRSHGVCRGELRSSQNSRFPNAPPKTDTVRTPEQRGMHDFRKRGWLEEPFATYHITHISVLEIHYDKWHIVSDK